MKLQMFAIKDRAMNAFMQPFFMHTIGQAIRAFSDNINDEKSQAAAHPDDYDLWYLGEWDDQTGLIQADQRDDRGAAGPYQIAIGKNLVTTK